MAPALLETAYKIEAGDCQRHIKTASTLHHANITFAGDHSNTAGPHWKCSRTPPRKDDTQLLPRKEARCLISCHWLQCLPPGRLAHSLRDQHRIRWRHHLRGILSLLVLSRAIRGIISGEGKWLCNHPGESSGMPSFSKPRRRVPLFIEYISFPKLKEQGDNTDKLLPERLDP